MRESNRLIVAILLVAAIAIGFWMLLLGPKRDEAGKLGGEVEQLQTAVTEARSLAAEAERARHAFPSNYRQLVVLGKAVPASDETSSLLVEMGHIADDANVEFDSIEIQNEGEGAPPPSPVVTTPPTTPPAEGGETGAVPASATVPPTEVAAAVMPLGASVGTAGLGVMPYTLKFRGSFFQIADFIDGVDSLVEPDGTNVAVDGRLLTLNGFSLNADAVRDFPYLSATFSVTTYVTPPSQGLTAGATPSEPAPASTEEAPAEESAPVSNEQ